MACFTKTQHRNETNCEFEKYVTKSDFFVLNSLDKSHLNSDVHIMCVIKAKTHGGVRFRYSNHPNPHLSSIIIFIVGLVAPTSISAIWCHSPPHPLQSFLYTLGFTTKYPPPPIIILIVKLVAYTSRVSGPSFIFDKIVNTTPFWISKCLWPPPSLH